MELEIAEENKGGNNMSKKKVSMKNMVICSLFLVMVLSAFYAGDVLAVGNVKDTPYSFNYTGDGGDLYTPYRDKRDYTSAYAYNRGTVHGHFSVLNGFTNYTYGASHYRINVGQARYLPNLIKESGLNWCRLRITPATHSRTRIFGLWSPDSV